MGSTLVWQLTKHIMGGNINGYNGTMHCAIAPFCVELEAFKICEGWATWEGDVALPTNAMNRRFLDDWISCISAEIVMTHAWCRVCALYEICSQWCGRRRKEFHVCHHCEKLAIAFGLINTNLSILFQIRKNLWVCEDCHTSTNVHLKK
jgi:hypothetical protein